MYAKIKCRNQTWGAFYLSKYLIRPNCFYHGSSQSSHKVVAGNKLLHGSLIRRHFLYSFSSRSIATTPTYLEVKPSTCLRTSQLRFYSSEGGDGRNASEDKHIPLKDGITIDKEKNWQEKGKEDIRNCDAHARLGEQDQKEWLINEKLSIETRKKDSPFLTRREKFKNEFLRKVVPWEKITVSWDTFPYYIK